MCGLFGFLDPSAAQDVVQLYLVTKAMADVFAIEIPTMVGCGWTNGRVLYSLTLTGGFRLLISPEGTSPCVQAVGAM